MINAVLSNGRAIEASETSRKSPCTALAISSTKSAENTRHHKFGPAITYLSASDEQKIFDHAVRVKFSLAPQSSQLVGFIRDFW